MLSPEVRHSPRLVEQLLDSSFREIGASGRLWTRAEMIRALAAEHSGGASITQATDFEGMVIGEGLVLLTYLSTQNGRQARRSSLWRFREGTWRVLFHQGTAV